MSARRRTRRVAPAPERHLELIKRARAAVPSLPTAKLQLVHDLLERVLAQPGTELGAEALAELEQALDL